MKLAYLTQLNPALQCGVRGAVISSFVNISNKANGGNDRLWKKETGKTRA